MSEEAAAYNGKVDLRQQLSEYMVDAPDQFIEDVFTKMEAESFEPETLDDVLKFLGKDS